ncbi:MAG TPA: glucose-6-phosphate dehydrogenase, partial [Alphaproteobacteria bacterium]|nr:glucose-6-phosphate dehydrogenase [Alphaproteobacteria bacterium]
YARHRPADEQQCADFTGRLHYLRGAYDHSDSYRTLRERLDELDRRHHLNGNRIFYLALPASEFPEVVRRLSAARLLTPHVRRPWSRVVIEKPFGHDLASARELNNLMIERVDEPHIFRIDHYMAKETVQNILALRFANAIFEPIWSRKYIDHVQITAAEEIGVEWRGRFYEQTGVIRDFVQSHLLEILALVAMEPPVVNDPDSFRDKKIEALRSVRCLLPSEVSTHAVRGQYTGYRQEKDVAPDSQTPTYAALKIYLDNWRWQGVPFYLRAGKRLPARLTEAVIHFQRIPLCLFCKEEACANIAPNTLTLRVQPDEGISLGFMGKVPGDTLEMRPVSMDFRYRTSFDRPPMDAYERVLLDCLRGDQMLFWRSDGVEAAWRIVTPILEAWDAPGGEVPLYGPDSDGPEAAKELLRSDGHLWRPIRSQTV